MIDQNTSLSSLKGWPVNIPVYLNLTNYLGWLYNQNTSLFTSVDCVTNKSAYLSWLTHWSTNQSLNQDWLTDQHTSLSIWVDWTTNIPDHLSSLTDQRASLPTYPGWPTDQHITWLSIQPNWLTNIHDNLSSPTDQKHISLSVRVDWTISIPAYPPRLPEFLLIYQPIWADWQTSLSEMTVWPTYQPVYPGWFTNQHTWLFILGDSPIAIVASLSGLTDWPTHQPIYPRLSVRLTDQSTYQLIHPD